MSQIVFEEVSRVFMDLYPADMDHGVEHHRTVFGLVLQLANIGSVGMETLRLALFSAAIHDTMDSKYKCDEAEVRRRIEEFGFSADEILEIITNMSWSKRKTNKVRPALKEARDLAMYADWIDSIRLDRCISYTQRTQPAELVVNTVVKHVEEKLAVIINELPVKYRVVAEPMQAKLLKDTTAYEISSMQ